MLKKHGKFKHFWINTNLIKIPKNSQTFNVLSLFSGAGGMDLGFVGGFEFLNKNYQTNPFNIVFANDILKPASKVYEFNFKHKVETKSISDLTLEKDFPNINVDVILGGFPCQTFSYSGKRAGLSDKRGQLYLEMIRVIDHYKPKIFIAENVDGIRNSNKNFKGENVNQSALTTILNEFEDHGYYVQYQVLNAANYGVPQIRRRVIIIGIRKDLGNYSDVYYPEPLFDETGELTGNKWISAKDAIDDLWDKLNDPFISNHSIKDVSKAKFYLNKKMQGNNRIHENKPAPTIRAEHHGNIEGHYRTLLKDKNDISGWRRLSVRECARLQSFPDTFNFVVSASAAYKVIGNAVPPVMAWHIARATYYTLMKLDKNKRYKNNNLNKQISNQFN
ncbi:DNA cytosine methyltransferase [Mycoplasma sp. E35C]|uniref:DNA cytosine methyltransferase n=1 Tax=Mycoplasma sp. E35C TaxID=2801918 RepID=UPI001CA40926|nr:DNA cytosine methyltransferase [Mycoplasma sp. E35C]QZX49270.1 DNA cytosine methyltransferase [Mycoplasma sp. E35C]